MFCKLLIINDSDCWKYVRKVRIVRIYLSKACLKRAFFAEIAFSQVEITRDRVSGLAVHTKNGKMKTET